MLAIFMETDEYIYIYYICTECFLKVYGQIPNNAVPLEMAGKYQPNVFRNNNYQ